jgi:hypothetical protein
MRWSLFCRVVDNYGDAGFCLRLARELRVRGEEVDLFIDDPRPLAWMQRGEPWPVPALPWPAECAQVELGEVVIEAFGCELPDGVLRVIGRTRPLWINLEYLSAEAYVERSHGLPSPQTHGPAAGAEKHFFYPGFTAATGGLLREQGLGSAQTEFATQGRKAWLAAQGWEPNPGEALISLFAYPHAPLQALMDALAQRPTLLLVAAGLDTPMPPPGWRVVQLPWLSQSAYDRLLWSCDLNLVRGEDSLVRGLWAGGPLLWQLYPQETSTRSVKLEAWLGRMNLPTAAREAHRAWNALAPTHTLSASLNTWLDSVRGPCVYDLDAAPDLVGSLLRWSRLGPERSARI